MAVSMKKLRLYLFVLQVCCLTVCLGVTAENWR